MQASGNPATSFRLCLGCWGINVRQCPQLAAPDAAFSFTGAHGSIVFIKEPSSQDALQGRRALLRCEVEAPGHIHVYWLLDGVQVHDTERRFAQGSSLSFTAVDRLQDSGTFQCVARDNSTGEEARSANATFNIKCEDPVRHPLPMSAAADLPFLCTSLHTQWGVLCGWEEALIFYQSVYLLF